MFGILRQIQGWAKIKGDTDGTMIGNEGDTLKTTASVADIAYTNHTLALLGIVQSSGFLSGESYDEIVYTESGGDAFLAFNLSNVAQFVISIMVTDQENWRVIKVDPVGNMLQEDGFSLLQETGDALLVQGLIPN